MLNRLRLYRNDISDLTPLSGLTSLRELSLAANDIMDLSPLTGLTALHNLYLSDTNVSELPPLVENAGLAAGDTIEVLQSPLSDRSLDEDIPALQERGVKVFFDRPAGTY